MKLTVRVIKHIFDQHLNFLDYGGLLGLIWGTSVALHRLDRMVPIKDSSELDEEAMAMITRRFTKFFKKTKESTRKKHPSKFKNTNR